MRSRTSRGVPEWSGGKDLYIGSMVLATGSVLDITGSVPGPPEVSGGPPSGATIPGGLLGLSVGEDQPQVGWCAPHKAQGARKRGKGQTLGQMGPKAHSWCASLSPSPLAAPFPWRKGQGCASPLSLAPIYSGGEGGQPQLKPWRLPPSRDTSSSPAGA